MKKSAENAKPRFFDSLELNLQEISSIEDKYKNSPESI